MVVLGVTVVGVVFGAILSVAATSSVGSVVHGALSGVYLSFSLWGIKTTAVASGEKLVAFHTAFLPIPGVAAPIVAVVVATRFALARIGDGAAAAIAFVGKLALLLGVLYAIAGALLSLGSGTSAASSPLGGGGNSSDFYARVSGANAFLYPLLIGGLAALVVVWRARELRAPERLQRPLVLVSQAIRVGGIAFGAVAGVLGLLATLGAAVLADSGAQRLVVVLTAPLVLVNTGIAATTTAMGASVAFTHASIGSFVDEGSISAGHVSLMHFGLPAASNAGSAPVFLLVLLVVAPIVIGWSVLNELTARRPSTEQQILGSALSAALGFAFVAWFAGLFGRLDVAGLVVRQFPSAPDGIGGELRLRPSVGAVLGLGLLWGVVGAFAAAFWWGSAHGVKWSFVVPSSGAAGPAPVPGAAAPVSPSPGASWSAPSTVVASPPPPTPGAAATWGDTPTHQDDRPTWWNERSDAPAQPSPSPAGQQTPTQFCTQCGTSLAGDVVFCVNCGSRLS